MSEMGPKLGQIVEAFSQNLDYRRLTCSWLISSLDSNLGDDCKFKHGVGLRRYHRFVFLIQTGQLYLNFIQLFR
jgi:hypothetical protein